LTPASAGEKGITFTGQGNKGPAAYVLNSGFDCGLQFVGLETQESVWAGQSGPDRLSLFVARMRRNWRLAAAVVAVSVSVATALAFVLPSYWRVEEILMPVPRSPGGALNLGSLAGLVGGLGDMGGGLSSILGRSSSNQDEALAVLNSRELFDTYATKENLLPILFASKWDDANHRWLVSGSSIPTLRRGYRLFDRSIRDVELDRRSGIVTFSITWKDRALAMKWARDLVDLTNAQLRAHAMDEAGREMRYLSDAMRKAGGDNDSNQLSATLATSYERSLQNYMFAKGEPEYAFRIIDPPTYPDNREHIWPLRSVFIILGFVLGLVLAVGAVYAREGWRGRREYGAGLNPHALPEEARAAR
jgi:uncharacterized protein involved in exopolysaccharide biosynthesis